MIGSLESGKQLVFKQSFILNNQLINSAGECPYKSEVSICSPKCKEDSECTAQGKICCSNICNQKSCILPKSNSGSKGSSSSGGAGSYCGNTKCNSYEKCELDRSTKRMKCVRS